MVAALRIAEFRKRLRNHQISFSLETGAGRAPLRRFVVVFLVWILLFSGARGFAATPEEITFVGYNLRNYLPMDRRIGGKLVEDAPKPENEVAALVAHLCEIDPDILGVSEIGGMSEMQDLRAKLKLAGVDLPHGTWLEAHDRNRHLAILSRHPITETHSQRDLIFQIDGNELPHNRGIIDATVQVRGNYSLRVVGVHLKSKREVEEADHNVIRRNEAALLRKHVDAILEKNPQANVLVFGDFNATRNELPIGIVRGSVRAKNYLRAIDLEDEDGERWTYYWSYADQYSRFDFIFASRGFMREVEAGKSYIFSARNWYVASDHRPLVLRFVAEDREGGDQPAGLKK